MGEKIGIIEYINEKFEFVKEERLKHFLKPEEIRSIIDEYDKKFGTCYASKYETCVFDLSDKTLLNKPKIVPVYCINNRIYGYDVFRDINDEFYYVPNFPAHLKMKSLNRGFLDYSYSYRDLDEVLEYLGGFYPYADPSDEHIGDCPYCLERFFLSPDERKEKYRGMNREEIVKIVIAKHLDSDAECLYRFIEDIIVKKIPVKFSEFLPKISNKKELIDFLSEIFNHELIEKYIHERDGNGNRIDGVIDIFPSAENEDEIIVVCGNKSIIKKREFYGWNDYEALIFYTLDELPEHLKK